MVAREDIARHGSARSVKLGAGVPSLVWSARAFCDLDEPASASPQNDDAGSSLSGCREAVPSAHDRGSFPDATLCLPYSADLHMRSNALHSG